MRSNSRFSVLAALAAGALVTADVSVSAAVFPTDANGAYKVNVVRHFDSSGAFTTGIAGYNPNSYNQEQGGTAGAIDGAYRYDQWDPGTVSSTSTAGFDITLDQVYSLKEFNVKYGGYKPTQGYQISVSTTGFGALTPAVTGGVPSANQTDVLTVPVSAKYIRYTWTGANNYIQLQEFHAYADSATNPFPITTDGGYDIVAMGSAGPVVTTDLTPGKWVDPVSRATDLDENSYLRGAGTGDATFQVDLGNVDKLVAVALGFYPSQPWSNGAKIEVSTDNGSYTTVFDSHSSVDTQNIAITPTPGRYVRVTNYGGSGNALSDFQVFGAPVPEPASLGLLALGGLLLRRRR